MIKTKPQVNPSGRYSVKAVCRILGIGASTLRTYKRNGLIKPINTNGRPKYRGYAILALWCSKQKKNMPKLPEGFSCNLLGYAGRINEYFAGDDDVQLKVNELTKTLCKAVNLFEQIVTQKARIKAHRENDILTL